MTDELLPACTNLCHTDGSVPVHPTVYLLLHAFAYGSSIHHNHGAKELTSRLLMVLRVTSNRQQIRLIWQKLPCIHLHSFSVTKNTR